MITIQGLTPLQQMIADQLWSLDTRSEVDQYIRSMPQSMQAKARVVEQMIIAAELDQVMEITDEVRDYLSSR